MIKITNMEMFKLAQNAVSNDKTRQCITGLHIKPCGTVQATDGHIATTGKAVEGGIIIKTKKIPANQVEGEIDLNLNIIRTKNRKGEESLQPLTVVDKRFPELENVIPADDREGTLPNITVNPHLIALLTKHTSKDIGIQLRFGTSSGDAILIKYDKIPEATSVLMPMRWTGVE